MSYTLDESDRRPSDGFVDALSSSFIAAMCEMLVALAVAAAICVGVVSLSAHLNEAQTVRLSAAGALQRAALPAPHQPAVSTDLD